MAFQLSASEARELSQNNRLILEEVDLLELSVLDAILANQLSAVYGIKDDVDSTVVLNGIAVTNSVMTNLDATGQAYYNAWQNTVADAVKTEQMSEVMSYFTSRGYTIARKSTNNLTFYWEIKW